MKHLPPAEPNRCRRTGIISALVLLSIDSPNSIAALWNIGGWPSLRFIGADGRLHEVKGESEEQLKNTIETLLAELASIRPNSSNG